MAADPRFHCKINGEGYVLIDESYAVQPQRPFNPRFSTGDPSLGDLSFWQFLAQENFSGGEGQEIFSDTTKFKKGLGWDLRDGKPRITLGQKTPGTITNAPITHDSTGMAPVRVLFFANAIYLVYPCATASLAALARRQILARSSNFPDVYQVNAYDAVIMRRDSAGTTVGNDEHLALVHGKTLRFVDSAFATTADITLTHYGVSLATPSDNSKYIFVGGNHGSGSLPTVNGQLTLTRIELTSNAWTAAGTKELVMDGSYAAGSRAHKFLPGGVFDSSGTLHMCIADSWTAEPGLRVTSKLVRIIAADLVATEFSITSVTDVGNFIPDAISEISGTVYLFGLQLTSPTGGYRAIRNLAGAELWRSEKIYTTLRTDQSIAYFSTFKKLNSIMFYADHGDSDADATYWKTIYELRQDGTVVPIQGIVSRSVSGHGNNGLRVGICELDGFVYTVTNNKVYRSSVARGFNTSGFATTDVIITEVPASCDLHLSRLTGGTQLIEKSLYKVIVEISEALPTGGELQFLVNGTVVATMTSADGTRLEKALDDELTGKYFDVVVRATPTMEWYGYLKGITLQYLPTQLKKLAWGFAVRATKGLKLLNGQFEERAPEKIVADLKAAWAANAPLEFVDIDGETYSAIVTEFKARMPLAADKVKDREFLVSLELLEV